MAEAGTIGSVTATFTGQATELAGASKQVRAELEQTGQATAKLSAQMDKIPTAAERAASAMQRAGAMSERASQRAAQAQATLNATMEASVPKSLAAAAALRVVEGNVTNNIRAAERFLGVLPGVGEALQAAFPVIGAVAFLGVVSELGKRVAEALDLSGERARKTQEQIRGVGVDMDRTNDSIEVQIDKLQEEQAKLEKKPFNGTKLAIDEAAESADRLAERLDNALSKWREVVIGMAASETQQLLGGTGTDYEQILLKEHVKWIDLAKTTQDQLNESVSHGNSLQTRLAELKKLQTTADQQAVDNVGGMAISTNYQNEIDATEVLIAAQQKEQQSIQRTIDLANEQKKTQTDRDNDEKKRLAKEALREREEAARKALEAQRKAEEDQMRGFEEGLAALRQGHQVSVEEEQQYWVDKFMATSYGSKNQATIYEKLGQLNQRVLEQAAESAKRQSELETSIERQDDERYAKETSAKRKLIEDRLKLVAEQQRGVREDASAGYAGAQESTAAAVEVGSISPAQRLEQLKAALGAATQAKLASLQAEMEAQAAALGQYRQLYGRQSDEYQQLLAEETNHLQAALDEQTKLIADASKQMAALQREAMEEGWQGALNDIVRKATDVDGQLKSLIESTVGTLNDSIIKDLTEPRQNRQHLWKDTGKSLFTGVAKTGLQDAEGGVLKAFGLGGAGKLGTQGNPMWVKSADAVPGAGSLNSTFGQAAGGPSGGGFSGFVASALSSGLPFLADGGPFARGSMAIVGERGPEIAHFGSSGYMHSNSSLRQALSSPSGSSGGGDTHHHWNIDARGATDPAAVNRQIAKAIASAAPHIVAGSIAAQKEMDSRRPRQPSGM